jgi:hypothetical protein
VSTSNTNVSTTRSPSVTVISEGSMLLPLILTSNSRVCGPSVGVFGRNKTNNPVRMSAAPRTLVLGAAGLATAATTFHRGIQDSS